MAQLTGLTRKTVNTIFLKIRERMAEDYERLSPLSAGEVEADESYFGLDAYAASAGAAQVARPLSLAS